MLQKIINIIRYKYEEFKATHKIKVMVNSVILEGEKVKVLYRFKNKYSSTLLWFFIEDLVSKKLELKFKDTEEILLFELLGVYKYLSKYSDLSNIICFLDEINEQLQRKI